VKKRFTTETQRLRGEQKQQKKKFTAEAQRLETYRRRSRIGISFLLLLLYTSESLCLCG